MRERKADRMARELDAAIELAQQTQHYLQGDWDDGEFPRMVAAQLRETFGWGDADIAAALEDPQFPKA